MQGNRCFSARKLLFIAFSVPVDLNLEPDRERIHHGRTDTVKTAGYFISAAAELSARMQNRKYHFDCRNSQFLLNIDGNSSSVVLDCHGIVAMYRHFNLAAVTGQCLIDGIIHNFVHEMMQSPRRGRTDVHARSLPNCFQTFQNLYLVCVVFFTHALSSSVTSVTVPIFTKNFLEI